MNVRYKQLVTDFSFERETITPFGGDQDATMCRTETLFKEISNRSLAAKHALWKGGLWLPDDLINDIYFTALDARAEIEAYRFAIYTGSDAYWDKRRNASRSLLNRARPSSRSREDGLVGRIVCVWLRAP
jgi:hypothetical protein